MKIILLTQKNRLKPNSTELDIIQKLAYHSARLYNVGLYSVRQFFFANDSYLNYSKNYHCCKDNENYKLLLSDSAQQTLRVVEQDMKSFLALLRMKKAGKYSEKIHLPRYKKKEGYTTILVQGRSARIRNGFVHVGLSKGFKEEYKTSVKELVFKLPKNLVKLGITDLQELRILPHFGGKEFSIEFVYKKEITSLDLNKSNFLLFVHCEDLKKNIQLVLSLLLKSRFQNKFQKKYCV
ncbi:MAG: putative transposase [bacterium]|jgi:putative transposase